MDAVEMIIVERIAALHPITDQNKLALLADAMRANGWQGRPLVVHQDDHAHYQAWTGSHRLRAAVAAGLAEVPCYVVEGAEYNVARESTGWNGRYDQPYDAEMITPDLRDAGFCGLAGLLEQG